MASVVEMISHYQRSIDKSQDNPARLLHCVEKLSKLPVTVEHLTVTKVGCTINDLRRKHEGEVNYAARALVTKWKEMVASEEVEDEETASPEQNDNNVAENDEEDEDDNMEGKLEIDFQNQEEEETSTKVTTPPPPEKSSSSRHHKHSRSSKSRHKDRHRDKESSSSDKRSSSSSHKSSHHKKDDKRDEKRDKKSTRDEKNDHKKEKDKEKTEIKSKDRNKKEEKDKSKGKRSSDEEKSSTKKRSSDEEKSSSKKRSSDEEKSSSKKRSSDEEKAKKRKREPDHEVEIDSSMGASFADALGFLDMPSSSKIKLKKPVTATTSKDNTNKDPKTPVLLAKKPRLEPLPDIASEIAPIVPTISTNYRPMPLNQAVMDCVFKEPQQKQKTMTDDEAFAYIIQSKKERTRMFSGQKSSNKVIPSLFDLCINVVQNNVVSLEYTGGIPFDILKPILEKVSFEQLLRLEDYNSYLIEDTDYIWKQHAHRRFRGKKPEELESWREMFLRIKDEQEIRLENITKDITLRNKQKVPEKTTKLAYVDNYVKPPRGVQSKQMRYGTDRLATASPAARVPTLNGVAANIAKVGDTRLKVAAAIRDTVPTHTPRANPNRKAPLMQKTLMSMKKCFKR